MKQYKVQRVGGFSGREQSVMVSAESEADAVWVWQSYFKAGARPTTTFVGLTEEDRGVIGEPS